MIQPEENHVDELSIFTPPPANTAIQRREWFEYRPVNQISDYASLDFLVPPQAAGYMDLKRSTLRVKVRLTDGDDKPISKDENVALVNLPLHSLFTQVDCSLQQTGVGQTGTNYAYKAYIDTLLSTGANDRVELDSQSFVKDTSGHFDDANVRDGSNTGLYIRSIYTDSGKILEMEGPIHLDIFRQNRLIVNGVSLSLKFHQSKNAFRLMSSVENAAYKTQIVDASFKLCVQKPNAGVLMAHSKLLQDETALYPHLSSRFKIASVSKGEYSHSQNNLFEGEVPSQLIVGLVSSAAYGGDYKKSPFRFQTFDCNFLALYVDGQSYPAKPLQPNFSEHNYVEAYRTLTAFRSDIDVSLADFNGGYALFVLNIDDNVDFNTKRRGDCRLELKFGAPLPESVTVLMYGKFPRIMHVDHSRSVLLQ